MKTVVLDLRMCCLVDGRNVSEENDGSIFGV
jgi:hypothetical protein